MLLAIILQSVPEVEGLSYGSLFFKTIIATIFIIFLAFALMKWVLPHVSHFRRKSSSSIQILDYQPLDVRKGIYIVQIDDCKMAIGASESGLTKLTEWKLESFDEQ